MNTRICSKCIETKDISFFYKNRDNICKKCQQDQQNEYRKTLPLCRHPEGCNRNIASSKQDYCALHCARIKRFGDLGPVEPLRKDFKGEWYVTIKGYIGRNKAGLIIYQHREFMEDYLGRELIRGEEVHHINGVKDDNRIENLELWIVSQPAGQRASDLVKWAHEILDKYEKEVVQWDLKK